MGLAIRSAAGGDSWCTWPAVHKEQRNSIWVLGVDPDEVDLVFVAVKVFDWDGELREFVYFRLVLSPGVFGLGF